MVSSCRGAYVDAGGVHVDVGRLSEGGVRGGLPTCQPDGHLGFRSIQSCLACGNGGCVLRHISMAQAHGYGAVRNLRVVLPGVCVGFRHDKTSYFSGTDCHAAVSAQCMVWHPRVVKTVIRGDPLLALSRRLN